MPIIEVDHLTKEYRLGAMQGLKQTLLNSAARLTGKKVQAPPLFKALDDVSFSIEPGEVVGIIGHNGAGKSTLLKMLAKISTPTRGSVKADGRIAPLIEVGAGFVPDFTGRENVYLNGAILGLSRQEIDKKFDEIVAFAEMEEFIDTPVKRYSSGMQVKLAFSVATSIDAEILIVDEVLAVGDLAFQRKCFDRMEDLIKRQGRTVLLVSHNLRQVERLCSRAILLDHGKVRADGGKSDVCELFYQQNNKKIAEQVAEIEVGSRFVRKTGEVELETICLVDEDGNETDDLVMGRPVTIRCTFSSNRHAERAEIIFGFHTTDFFYIASMGNGHIEARPDIQVGKNTVECHINSLALMPGVYCLRLGILDKFPREMFYAEMLRTFTVRSEDADVSKMPALGVVFMPASWSYQSPPLDD